jgi:glycosyltransferase involved in cell wall biosynthesis
MRAGMLLDALRRLGPVHVVVIPVHGRPLAQFPSPAADGVRYTVVDVDLAADERADFIARVSRPATRLRADGLHPRPSLCRSATVATTDSVAELVADARLVLVDRLYLAPFVDVVLDDEHRPVCVIDVDDVESSTRRQFGDFEEADRYERLERHYLSRFDRVLVCSEDDAQDVAARCGVDVDVVPNAVALPDIDVHAAANPRWDLLFVGNLSYRPNVDAARWLCTRLRPALPSASIALVGRDPSPEVEALTREGRVYLSGTVPEVGSFYAASRVAVVPVMTGGGTSIKLLEAMAHSRPVVSTSVGARGLRVRHGEHLLVADEPAAFAEACRFLLADPARATELAAAGHEFVRQSFTVEMVASALVDLLRSDRGSVTR